MRATALYSDSEISRKLGIMTSVIFYTRTRTTAAGLSRTSGYMVLRNSGDVVHIADAARILGFTRTQAAKLLSRWAGQGWLRRVGRGIYGPVPLDSLESVHVLDDPWILVPTLYAPAYIGARTAAQHWDLTEQIFRDIVVLTAEPVRKKSQIRHGAPFSVKHIDASKIFGIRTLWWDEAGSRFPIFTGRLLTFSTIPNWAAASSTLPTVLPSTFSTPSVTMARSWPTEIGLGTARSSSGSVSSPSKPRKRTV